jgi:hypothetical protein
MLTNITCPGCGALIAVNYDLRGDGLIVECGGEGEGACDACYDDTNPDTLRRIRRAQGSAASFLAPEKVDVPTVTMDAALSSIDPFNNSAARAYWLHVRETRGW